MATKFGIRNYSRSGNNVTFLVVALNANGSIDTSYTGTFPIVYSNFTGPASATFDPANQGQVQVTATITNPATRASLAAQFPGNTFEGANLVIGENAETLSSGYRGDSLWVGGPGNDNYTLNQGDDLFMMHRGGDDTVNGGAGNDGFYFGAAYTVTDVVNGGTGNRDQIGLQGDYSGGVTLGSMLETELVVLLPGNDARFGGQTGTNLSYNIVANGSTIVTGNKLTIQANTLRAGENFTFNGSATGIDFLIYGGLGNDVLTGGSGNDGFFFGQGRFGAGDVVNGGAGTMDQLGLQGNYTASGTGPITFGAGQLSGLEFIVLLSANDNRFGSSGGTTSYDLTMNNGNVASGARVTIQANTLMASETLVFRGFFETDGNYSIFSGAGNDNLAGGQLADIIFGGAGNDFIEGQGGADQLTGGAGNDTFHYLQASHSAPNARDHITDFTTGDKIDLSGLKANTGGGNFTFIGGDAQTGARQVQVIQSGNTASVNVFIDGDATADMVIDVTVADGHTLTMADFVGTSAPPIAGAPDQASKSADMMLFESNAVAPRELNLWLMSEALRSDAIIAAAEPNYGVGSIHSGAIFRAGTHDAIMMDPVSLSDLVLITPLDNLAALAPTSDLLL